MAKRCFLQLCEDYHDNMHLNRWLISEKLDGMRCFWDGGISRGLYVKNVPWANVEKDKQDYIATGLWSRLGKVIFAPEYWLDSLPNVPLDGELYIRPGSFQEVISICRTQEGSNWSDVKLMVLDSPPLDVIFADGLVEVRVGNQKYSRRFNGIMDWIINNKRKVQTVKAKTDFESVLHYLKNKDIENKVVRIHEQKRLPMASNEIHGAIEEHFATALNNGAEGVVIRSHYEGWKPERVKYCLKYKPSLDSEAIVKDYIYGFGKHEGRMGAMIVQWGDIRFELSGFTDQERTLINLNGCVPGKVAEKTVENPRFPRGTVVTFRYRELTTNGVPKEAAFKRQRLSE